MLMSNESRDQGIKGSRDQGIRVTERDTKI